VDLTRRGFLRLMSAVAVTAELPVPNFVLAEPLVVVPEMPIALGAIRALAQYDIHHMDRHWVRLDAFNGKDQWAVDFPVAGHGDIRQNYLEARKVAEEVLRNNLIHEGWKASDLIALPVPQGYKEPAWMSA